MRYLTLLLLVSTVAVAEPCDPTPDPGVDPIRILQADQADIGNVDGHRVYYREPYVNWTWRLLADLPCTDYLWDPDDPGSQAHVGHRPGSHGHERAVQRDRVQRAR